ncbi:MAG: nicotinate phosphoribosyltransferase [Thermodesulfobacteriota bacterium]|nr:nicotinate phosphoribosyltransferase [Thermodesulfobacteriota bacterium]
MGMINSLLDTDFSRLTMAQTVLHMHPDVTVRYQFRSKNKKRIGHVQEINNEIDHLCSLRFTDDELAFLDSMPFFKKDFIEYLRLFQLNRKYVTASLDHNRRLQIEIKGPWISTVLFTIPILTIVNEIYSKYQSINEKGFHSVEDTLNKGEERLSEKIGFLTNLLKTGQLSGFKFADIETYQRYSHYWHGTVIERLKKNLRSYLFVGTSNAYFAMKHKMNPVFTMEHEWLMAYQQLGPRLALSQKAALKDWIEEYSGEPGICLCDVVGFNAFLRDFDLYLAKLFDGCQHSSGDPTSWCVKLIEHYDKLGIEPKTKTAMFSDDLNLETSIELHETLSDMIDITFGIGRNLTHDLGIPPLEISLEMVECNGGPVARIADDDRKTYCESARHLAALKEVFGIED